MKSSITAIKLDSRRRGVFPAPFRPGDVLVPEALDAGTVTFRVIRPADVPQVRPVKRGGYLLLPGVRASREAIASAVRAERDGG